MSTLASIDVFVSGRAVALKWSDGTTTRFHSVWLRDNALDPETRSEQNGQRLISVLDLPPDPRVESAAISSTGQLQITFGPEQKHVSYPADWLVQHAYDKIGQASAAWTDNHIERWDGALTNHVPTADFDDARGNTLVLADWLAAIARLVHQCSWE